MLDPHGLRSMSMNGQQKKKTTRESWAKPSSATWKVRSDCSSLFLSSLQEKVSRQLLLLFVLFFSLCFLFSAGEQALLRLYLYLSLAQHQSSPWYSRVLWFPVGCSAIEVWQISFYFPAVLVVFKETFAVWVRFPRETGLVQFIWRYSAITLKEAAEGGLCKACRSWTGRACPGATETRKLGSIWWNYQVK